MNDGPGIYVGRCIVTGKCYVGSSLKRFARVEGHKRALTAGKNRNKHLQYAYNKYGAENFTWEIVEICTREERFSREQWWIESLNSSDPQFGFNRAYPVRVSEPNPIASAIMQEHWQDPAKREVWLVALKKGSQEVQRLLAEDPAFAAKISAIRQSMHTAESRLNISEKAKLRDQDPAYWEQHLGNLAKGRAVMKKKREEDPAFMDYSIAGMLKQWESQKRRDEQAERMRNLWKDPEFRSKQVDKARRQIIAYNKRDRTSTRDSLNNGEPEAVDTSDKEPA